MPSSRVIVRTVETTERPKPAPGGWLCWRSPYGPADFFFSTGTDFAWYERKGFARIAPVSSLPAGHDLEEFLRATAEAVKNGKFHVAGKSDAELRDALLAGADLWSAERAKQAAEATVQPETPEEKLMRITGQAFAQAMQSTTPQPADTPEPEAPEREPGPRKRA